MTKCQMSLVSSIATLSIATDEPCKGFDTATPDPDDVGVGLPDSPHRGIRERFAFSKLRWADPISGSPPQSSVCIDRGASRPTADLKPTKLAYVMPNASE